MRGGHLHGHGGSDGSRQHFSVVQWGPGDQDPILGIDVQRLPQSRIPPRSLRKKTSLAMQLSLGLLSGHLHRRLQVLNSRQDHPSADWIQILFGLLCQGGSGFSLQVKVFHWQLGIMGSPIAVP